MSQLWVSIIGKTLSPFKWVFTYGAKAFTLLVIKVVFEYNCDLSITNDFLFDGEKLSNLTCSLTLCGVVGIAIRDALLFMIFLWFVILAFANSDPYIHKDNMICIVVHEVRSYFT